VGPILWRLFIVHVINIVVCTGASDLVVAWHLRTAREARTVPASWTSAHTSNKPHNTTLRLIGVIVTTIILTSLQWVSFTVSVLSVTYHAICSPVCRESSDFQTYLFGMFSRHEIIPIPKGQFLCNMFGDSNKWTFASEQNMAVIIWLWPFAVVWVFIDIKCLSSKTQHQSRT